MRLYITLFTSGDRWEYSLGYAITQAKSKKEAEAVVAKSLRKYTIKETKPLVVKGGKSKILRKVDPVIE